MKDYIEHCQADEEAQRATAQCKNAASQPLPAAPLFKCDPTNDTVIRRTLGGILLGSTESSTYNNNYICSYALLLQILIWIVLSAICSFACKISGIPGTIAEKFEHFLAQIVNYIEAVFQYHRNNPGFEHQIETDVPEILGEDCRNPSPQRLRDRDEAATGSQHPSSTIEQVWGITTSTRNASSGIKYIKDNKPTILERYV